MGTNGTTDRQRLALDLAIALSNGQKNAAYARRVLDAAKRAGVQHRDLVRATAQLKAGLPPDTDDAGDDGNHDTPSTPFVLEPHAVRFTPDGRVIHGRGDSQDEEHENR